jgi:SAM-dependent methyltransferase
MSETSALEPVAFEATPGKNVFYDELWSRTFLTRPERFNTWPLIAALLPNSPARLELGPGLRPRMPIAGTHFIDLSATVVERLNGRGARAQKGCTSSLPFEDGAFDLVCAFDVIEHVESDLRAFTELSRVLKKDGVLIFSVPLHAGLWSPFDDFVGHLRRYDPSALTAILKERNLLLEKSAVFGMQPSNPRLLSLGTWFLTHRSFGALFWYNLFLPFAIFFQKTLKFSAGMPNTSGVGELLLVCRRCK